MKPHKNVLEKIYKILLIASCVALFVLMVLLVANIITRAVFNAPIYGTVELVSYLVLISVALALPANEWAGGNVSVTLLVEKMKPRRKNVLDITLGLISTAVIGFISYDLVLLIFDKYTAGDLTDNLSIPQWIFAVLLALGFALATVCFVHKLVRRIAIHKSLSDKLPNKEYDSNSTY